MRPNIIVIDNVRYRKRFTLSAEEWLGIALAVVLVVVVGYKLFTV